jgi:hypothetical protein
MKISKESWVIFTLGIADLTTTLLWVHHHGAEEANPLFAHYLDMGSLCFSLMKIIMLAAPIFLLEWARRRRPRFTIFASRFAIAAYLVMYGVGYVRLNGLPGQHVAQVEAADMVDLGPSPAIVAPEMTPEIRDMRMKYRAFYSKQARHKFGDLTQMMVAY